MDERELGGDPLAAMRQWLLEGERSSPGPQAMTLATATADGRPSARIVLLRELDEHGLTFFTNLDSRKGEELRQNPQAALVLHWWELGRQLRVEGGVDEVSVDEAEDYWRSRPRESRIAAWASPQSRPLGGRAELDAAYDGAEARFAGQDVPLPPHWGGFRIRPEVVEFWLHRDNRLHDRVRYVRTARGWRRERLAP
jgi:pyridoxamine 5'-phosphate oxidase